MNIRDPYSKPYTEELVAVSSSITGDWYQIQRKEHEGFFFFVALDDSSGFYVSSARLDPLADIEGTKEEIVAFANAIVNHTEYRAKRIKVWYSNPYKCFMMMSPRNSGRAVLVSEQAALMLALQIIAEIDVA